MFKVDFETIIFIFQYLKGYTYINKKFFYVFNKILVTKDRCKSLYSQIFIKNSEKKINNIIH